MATRKTSPGDGESAEAMSGNPDAFEAALKGYDRLIAFGKDNAEALRKAVSAAGRAFESINGEASAFGWKSAEDAAGVAKAVLSSRSLDEAFQIQADFGRAAFDAYVDELAKLTNMALAAAKTTAEPLQARVSAFAQLLRTT